MDAVALEEVRDDASVLTVERREDLIGQLDHGDVEAALREVLRHLEADEPAAYDDGAHRRLRDLESRVLPHAGEEARPAFDPLADLSRVRHGPHLEDPGEVDAGQRRADGASSGDSTSLSYDSVVTSPLATSRSWTVLSSAEIPIASQPVRQSTANCSRKTRSFATSRSDSCSITPPTWYGRPQFAKETYGPRSTMTISARFVEPAQTRRARGAAGDAPDDDHFHRVTSPERRNRAP